MPNEPLFLDLADIIQIQADTVANEGGSPGIRDITLIESAVATPRSSFAGEYLHADMPAKVGALMFALISNHGFVDGNKRVGTLAALVFRQIHGMDALPAADELEKLVLSVARGEMGREELTDWWRAFDAMASD